MDHPLHLRDTALTNTSGNCSGHNLLVLTLDLCFKENDETPFLFPFSSFQVFLSVTENRAHIHSHQRGI